MVPNANELLARRASSDSSEPILVGAGLTKHFPGVRALDEVGFSIARGEIVALLGQNGAGKSTLIQIFAGAHPAGGYRGTLSFEGRAYRPNSVAEAEAAGVALVPQEINVVPDLTVAQNIALNHEPGRWGFIDGAERLRRARQALRDFALELDPERPMSSLDLATQQLVVIARALAKRARLLILDEPTAALTESESHRLFERMRALKARGVAIIFVSHRLGEVFSIADRIAVMRDGRMCGLHAIAEVTKTQIIAEMIGGSIEGPVKPAGRPLAEAALELRHFCVFQPDGRQRIFDLDLTVRKGEVVGLYGLIGSGCIEAALAAYDAWRGKVAGCVLVEGRPTFISGPDQAVLLGLGLMAQDRRDCLIGDQSICDNINVASLRRIAPRGLLDIAAGRRRAQDQSNRLHIRAPSIDAHVRTLSGGNQQKVQIGRWLAAETRVLIMIDPTRGVDVGARREIKRIWMDLSQRGCAILLASTDAEELVDACDRVIVMRGGRAAGELAGARLTEENLLRTAADG